MSQILTLSIIKRKNILGLIILKGEHPHDIIYSTTQHMPVNLN